MNAKAVLYDLSIAGLAVTLWLTPNNLTRAIGYSVSLLFSGRAYYTAICLLSKERREDEKEAISYEAEVDFYERLLENHIDSALEIKATQIETNTLERLIPLIAHKSHLERQLEQIASHPELSDQDREAAAKSAIDSAFVESSDNSQSAQPSEEIFRATFPETMDVTYWKAILKALGNGATRDEVIKDILGCTAQSTSLGGHYLDYLKQKFMI